MLLKWTFLLGLFLPSCSGCASGYTFVKRKCVDIDECVTDPGLCGDHAQCFNTPGSYYCNCNEGFRSAAANFTATSGECIDINECIEKTHECQGDMKCKNTIGSFECICPPGFHEPTKGSGCEDVDECVSSVCGVHSSCTNTLGSFHCICSPGFLKHENGSCTDKDECKGVPDVCGTNANCSNHQGSYSCKCHEGYSNYGNSQSKCTEMSCDHFESDTEDTPAKLKTLLALLRSSCESLRGPNGHQTGEQLLENLFTFTDELLSGENIADGKMLNHCLDAVENSMRLIGPQLKEPVTRMETHNTFAEVAVMRGQTPPSGRVILSTDSALFNTSWETVVGKSYPGFAFAALVSYKDLNSSSDLLHKMSNERSDDNKSVTYQLNSKVVTAVVSNAETKQLSESVTLVFRHVEERVESEGVAYSCVYWDETEGAWSGRGCKRTESNSTHTVCSCSHLSSFAVLMALYPVQDAFDLVLITRVGLVLSLVCLFLCILTFLFCRSIQGTRTSIHLHLSICLFIADLVFLSGISMTHNQVACGIVAGLLHFFFLSAFCWMLLEGVQLYRMVVLVFHTTLKHLYMYLVGYGVPLFIVTISAIAFPAGYGTSRHCWLSLDRYFILSFFAPVCIIVILNGFVFIITVWKLAKKFSSLNPDLSKLNQIRSFTVTAVAQLCVLGGTWVFGFFLFKEEGTEVMLYLFIILNTLQGALIFLMHCLLSKQVRMEYYNLFVRMCPHKKKPKRRTSTSQTNSSQKPLRSDGSTAESQM
ncbi:adhesion G protein-coupled receptor E1-like isoform X2 [Carassius auratus]|uniref:Adhesion G protein-coupled receptor E1-like isoform X2 n=1 Tax=Carassius auratus TaxID=7957 RepID=A0A6P6PHC6_CARAU|nr:adhesion G protein-coupled receptor E1-like isoform X2 [Carassius auratus]